MPYTGVVMHGPRVADHVAIAREAENLGFQSAWVTEVAGPDIATVLAAAATATTRIRLATGIAAIFVRDPYLSAMTFAALQDLSGGRVIAGFGTSTPAIVTGWHSLPWSKPLGHTREFVDIFRRLVAGERVKHEGLYAIRGASIRAAAGQPIPVYLGALNERMLELAGEIADGVILNFPTRSYLRTAIAAVERGLAKSGRSRADFDVVAFLRTVVSDDYPAAAAPIQRELISYFMAPVYEKVFRADGYDDDCDRFVASWRDGDRAGAVSGISEAFVREHAILGTPDECLAQARAMLDAGVDTAVLFPVAPEGAAGTETILQTVRALAPR
ncbi:MAG: LLM class F420-dependent oxidoreductase [Dehalococcoidia bacterium]